MSDSVSIRRATTQDSQSISNLMTEVAKEFSFPFMTENGKNKIIKAFSTPSINQYLNAEILFWIAEVNNQLVGVVSIENGKHLKHLFVSGKFQGKGISRDLWRVAKSYLKENSKSKTITVCSSPTAVKLYEKWGFEQVGELQDLEQIPFVPMEILKIDM